MDITIRAEAKSDYRTVEEVTREAFWNLYVPGCAEHFLAHVMRNHPDFIAELDFVAIYKDKIIGNIMYTKSYVSNVQDTNHRVDTITFGPISVLPAYQGKGVGSALIKHSLKEAKAKKCKAIIIQGHPHNYCKHSIRSSKDFQISDSEGKYPYSLLVLELEKGLFQGYSWNYHYSDVYTIDPSAAEEFDQQFKPKQKQFQYTQEEFSIACRAYLI